MNKLHSLAACATLFLCSVANAATPSAPAYTPEQKAEILKVAEISGFSFGATKAVLEACPTPNAQLVRYDAALKKYKDKLGGYSFGVDAQKTYDNSYNKSKQEMAAKLMAADKGPLCKEVGNSMEQLLQKLEIGRAHV